MATTQNMARHPRLYRRNATYYHRAAVPKDIADSYPKKEETFSLKTKDYKEALRLVRIAAAEVDKKFEEHRKRLQSPVQQELTEAQLQLIHDTYYWHLLDEDEEMRLAGFAGYNAAKSFEEYKELHLCLTDETKGEYARGDSLGFHRGEAEEILGWEGIEIKLAPNSPSWNKLTRTLQEATLKAAEAIMKRYEGEVIETPPQPATAPLRASSSPLLSVLFSERKAEALRTNEWSPKLVDDYQSWTDLFIEIVGDRPILEYKKADARVFKEALMRIPSNRNKHRQTKGLAPAEAIEAAEKHGLPTLSLSTINKALGRLQATWKWADKQLDEAVHDIFGPMKLKKRKSAREEADPFSISQLQTIFNGPLFTGCKSERRRAERGDTDMSGTSWFWLPLLGLWTGARLNELCQLTLKDIEDGGEIPYIRLHEGNETQRIKGHSKRNVPIHPELIRLGLLRFTNAQRKAGHKRLFPNLKVDASGYYSDRSSKDFSNYLKRIGAKTNTTSFHSFRHNFKDACRNGGVPPDINDILLGHTLSGMAARYGDGAVSIPRLYEAVCAVEYEGLSLQHINGFTD